MRVVELAVGCRELPADTGLVDRSRNSASGLPEPAVADAIASLPSLDRSLCGWFVRWQLNRSPSTPRLVARSGLTATTHVWVAHAWAIYAGVLIALGVVPFDRSWPTPVYAFWGAALVLYEFGYRRARGDAGRAKRAREGSGGSAEVLPPRPLWLRIAVVLLCLGALLSQALILGAAPLPALLLTAGAGLVVVLVALIRHRIASRRRTRDYPIVI